jgi:type II secretory ATPase GspE/PulE/Tfp pilus assembly ATPase PilB-like protein
MDDNAADKTSLVPFVWPAPPFASYPVPSAQMDPLPCIINGLKGQANVGRLTFFVPEQMVAHVQVPPARTTFPLRFDHFRSLVLTTPLSPLQATTTDPHAALLQSRPCTSFKLWWANGEEFTGDTIGHIENDIGLFLFLPCDKENVASGSVLRMFVPRSAYQSIQIGMRIGELLVEQKAVTPQQVEQAVQLQMKLRSQKLGDMLVTQRIVSPDQLLQAIEQQARMPMVRIGEALMSLGMLSEQKLQEALEQQKSDRSVPLGRLLVNMGVVSPNDLQLALARKMGYPLVNVDEFPVEVPALARLNYPAALRLQVLPLLIRDGKLIIAMDDPARRRDAVEEVEFIAQSKVIPVLADCRSIEDAIYKAYEEADAINSRGASTQDGGGRNESGNTDALLQSLEQENEAANLEDEKQIEQSDNSLVRLINSMILDAHKDGVSDIHIESYPGKDKVRVRFRKDGRLHMYLELPPNYRNPLIARIKIMCDLDISERRKPQDGKINFSKFSAQHKIELRVATIPTNSGLEDVVMRILASAKPIPLDNIGLSERNLSQLKMAIERPYGLVLCVGPTGSGKTTTLHSALSYINVPERKIWTAEDPVEITQPGLRQVQVNPKIDWTFARALRAFLRADPDVIMVGEIRDSETSHMAVEASLTGHLVMSTLHTNSAPETVTRLLDMGMDPFNFADSLLAVLAQRLVRRLCTHCRRGDEASPKQVEELLDYYMHSFGKKTPPITREQVLQDWIEGYGQNGRLVHYHSPGCSKCSNTGFKGRVGLHELMIISRDLRALIQTKARAEELQTTAMAEGMRTLRQDGIDKVVAGLTVLEEVRATSNS